MTDLNLPTLPRRHRALPATLLATTLTVALAGPFAAPAAAQTGLNDVEKDDWLPLTALPGEPLPDDRFLETDDCPFATDLPPAFDDAALPADGEPAPDPVPVHHPGPGGEALDTCGAVSAEGLEMPDRLSIGSYVVYDIDSGDVLAAKDPYGLYRPASVIKSLLLMTALDELDQNQRIPVSETAGNILGSRVGVGVGGDYTARELMLGLVMRSGNDAAVALAEAMGGEQETVRKMQDLADSLGAQATRVRTVHGLDSAGVQTTAYDMARIYRETFQRPDSRELFGEKMMDFPGYDDLDGFELSSDNELLFTYPGTIGGKTGFTDNARHTFSVAAERDGRSLGVVMLNTTIAAARPAVQATEIFDAAFAAPADAGIGTLEATADADEVEPEMQTGDDAAAHDGTDSADGTHGTDSRAVIGVIIAALVLAGLAVGAAVFRRR